VVHAAPRLAVVLDGVDQVAHDPDVALPQAAVAQRLRLAQAGAGDLLPGRPAAAGEPARVRQEVTRRQAAPGQLQDAARAVHGQAEARPAAVRVAAGGEEADRPAVEAVGRGDVVAGGRAHALGAVAHVGAGHRRHPLAAGHADPGEAPAGVAGNQPHQVHDVRAQHHQVGAAAAGVLLAAAAQLQDLPEPAGGDQFADALQAGAVARLVGQRQLDVGPLAGLDHLVGLGQGAAHRLFQEDAGPGAGAGDDHVAVAVEVAVGDADDLRPLPLQHLAVVGVGVAGVQAAGGGGPAGGVLVGDGDDVDVVERPPDDVEAGAVVAAAGAADDGDAVSAQHGNRLRGRGVGIALTLMVAGPAVPGQRDSARPAGAILPWPRPRRTARIARSRHAVRVPRPRRPTPARTDGHG